MNSLLRIFAFAVLLMFCACHHTSTKAKDLAYQYKKYSEVPQYIKTYIDSITQEKFLIAEPGEPWDAGCVISGNPTRLFISAKQTDQLFTMEFKSGGFVSNREKLTLYLDNGRITNYTHTVIK